MFERETTKRMHVERSTYNNAPTSVTTIPARIERRPEDRAPLELEPLPPQEVDVSLRLACALLPKREEHVEAVELPVWGKADVSRWREERRAEQEALAEATSALKPEPARMTLAGIARGIARAAIAIPLIIAQEARR